MMGGRNVARVLLAVPPVELPGAARWLLLLMAQAAHDDTQRCWVETDWLVLAMGYQAGNPGRRQIYRLRQSLVDAGYVKATDQRHGGHRVWQLQLPGVWAKRPHGGGQNDH